MMSQAWKFGSSYTNLVLLFQRIKKNPLLKLQEVLDFSSVFARKGTTEKKKIKFDSRV